MTELFCKLPHVIMVATYWISALTGEKISFTGDHKVIWAWMCKRFQFFQSSGREWFDNQEDIAISTGTSPATVKRFLTALSKHGYLEVRKRRSKGFIQSNSYKILSNLVVGSPNSVSHVPEPVPVPAPVPKVDGPEERIPVYAPIQFSRTVPKVSLISSPAPKFMPPKLVPLPAGYVEDPSLLPF